MNTAPAYPSARARRTGAATDGQQSDGPPRVAASSAAAGRPRASGSALPSPIRVVNKHAASREEKERAAYVGRGSALGNPFKVKPYGPHERGTTLPLYEDHLRGRLAQKHRPTCGRRDRGRSHEPALRPGQEGPGRGVRAAPHVLLRSRSPATPT